MSARSRISVRPSADLEADVVVVGAGIMGLATAFHLARRAERSGNPKRIVVVDRSYLCGGASGRNGGGVRAQWSSETNVRLMQESIRMCREFALEMRINVWFRQGGYLFLVRSEERRRALEASVLLQNACGLPTRMLTPAEARKVVPELDTNGVVAASYNAEDAVVFPWPFVWGFAQGATRLGVRIETFTEVVGIRTEGGKVSGIVLRRVPRGTPMTGTPLAKSEAAGASIAASGSVPPPGSMPPPSQKYTEYTISTPCIVNAAGAWSPEVACLLGVELPNKPHRHEICSTEPLKPWLKPLVADLSDGLYFSQSTRGEIVGGIGQNYVPEGINQESSHAFLGKYARSLTRACPILGAVKVLRQWSGCYDLTPDANPIVGEVDEVAGFIQASGFMGHGFMMAPVVGHLLAQSIDEGRVHPMFEQWNLRRFREGKLLSEGMIIG
jgi:sarcosine oxidase subunit beta